MQASERTLQQLLHSPDQYVIPVFQRYYTWGTDNWDKLLEEIDELVQAGNESRRHFMGSVVVVPDAHQPGVSPAYHVIDGQQRLMTLSLLFCAMRDLARMNGWEELATELNETYIVQRFKKGRERYKVYPRLRDRQSYLAVVDGTEPPAASGQIEAAHRYFAKHVESIAKDETELRRLFEALTARLDFVAITLGSENPYKIFRSLNSTGVDLTEADLIRNHVFMSLPIDEQDEFDDGLWRDLESRFVVDGTLKGKEFEAFFRDALMRDGTYIGRDATFEAFERRFPSGRFDARSVVSDLFRVSRLYDVVRGAVEHENPEIEAALRAIRQLNVTTAYPLVTALLERAVDNDLPLSRDRLLALLRAISSFVLRRFICGLSSRAYSMWFVAACRALESDPTAQVLEFLNEKGWPADEEFQRRFLQFNLYQSKYDRTILGALEMAIQVKSEPVGLDGCSIEHIMPRTIDEDDPDGKAWILALGAEWRRVHAEWLDTPGNLTLVGADYNAGMSNCAFEIKKPVLGGSKVYLNHWFRDPEHLTWNSEEIKARAKDLADLAVKVWPGPKLG